MDTDFDLLSSEIFFMHMLNSIVCILFSLVLDVSVAFALAVWISL